jgi:GMP synthase (glutamine-hydrolysing)
VTSPAALLTAGSRDRHREAGLLDVPGLVTRIHVHQHFGYFPPSEVEELAARGSPAVVTEPGRMLANFVGRDA